MAQLKDLLVTGSARIIGKVYSPEFVGKLTGNADTATNADKLDGFHGSSSQAANTYVLRDEAGYIYTNYINSNTSNNENPSISQIIVTNGDNFYRKASLSHLKSSLGSMPASDVYTWAKASTKPTYTKAEIGLGNVDNTADSQKSVKYATTSGSAITTTKLQTYKQGSTTETYGTQYPLYAQWEDSSNLRLKVDNYTVKVNYADKAGSASSATNATTATKLQTARTITLAGSVTGSAVFDGSVNVTITTSTNHSHNQYLLLSGGTMTGALTAPNVTASNYFMTPTMLGEGDLSTYYHRVDFGHSGFNQFDFYEYGGIYNFYQNQLAGKDKAVLLGKITSNGWVGNVVGNATSATTASSCTGNAATATALTSSAGSSTQPVYFSGGKPVVCTYTLNKSVPADAKFTDTDTWRPLGTTADTACAGNDSRLSNARPASDVYAWAKASTKPVYTWGEITGKPSTFEPSNHTHSSLKAKIETIPTTFNTNKTLTYNFSNNPSDKYVYITMMSQSTYATQIRAWGPDIAVRILSDKASNWDQIVTSSSLSSSSVKYATTAKKANSANLLNKNNSFLDSNVGSFSYYDADISNTTNDSNWSSPSNGWHQIYHNDLSIANYWTELAFPINDVNGLAWRQRRSSEYYGWYRILDSNNYTSYTVTKDGTGASGTWGINVSGSSASCTGNAATATKLQTPRTINGTSFDGSANITTTSWGISRNIYIKDCNSSNTGSGVSVNGSGNAYLLMPSSARFTGTVGIGNASGATLNFYTSATAIGAKIVAYNDRIEFVFA